MKKVIIALSLLFIPLLASASIDTNLYYGVQNKQEVQELQEFLIDKGFLTGNATGNFYSLTLNGVKKYQASVSINSTGYVGTLTRKSINDELVANLSASNQEAVTETGNVPVPVATPNPLVAQVQSLQQTVQQLVQNNASVTPSAPAPTPTVSAPVSKADLQVTNLTSGDVILNSPGHDTFKFKVTALDDNGNPILNPYPIRMTTNNYVSYFGYSPQSVGPSTTDGSGGFYASFIPNQSGEITLTFTYGSLIKTITVTALASTN